VSTKWFDLSDSVLAVLVWKRLKTGMSLLF